MRLEKKNFGLAVMLNSTGELLRNHNGAIVFEAREDARMFYLDCHSNPNDVRVIKVFLSR